VQFTVHTIVSFRSFYLPPHVRLPHADVSSRFRSTVCAAHVLYFTRHLSFTCGTPVVHLFPCTAFGSDICVYRTCVLRHNIVYEPVYTTRHRHSRLDAVSSRPPLHAFLLRFTFIYDLDFTSYLLCLFPLPQFSCTCTPASFAQRTPFLGLPFFRHIVLILPLLWFHFGVCSHTAVQQNSHHFYTPLHGKTFYTPRTFAASFTTPAVSRLVLHSLFSFHGTHPS